MESKDYVSDAVFRSEIRRIEQKVDNAVERMEMKMDVYTARLEAMTARQDGRLDKIEARLDGISSFVNSVIALSAVVITVGTFIIQIVIK